MYNRKRTAELSRTEQAKSNHTQRMLKEKLWNLLKNKKTYGLTFHKDEMIDMYHVDFCCHSEKIIIELSDFPFQTSEQMDKTMERHVYLIDHGFTILGFDGNTIHTNPTYIAQMIKNHVQINHAGHMENFNLDFDF